VLTGHDTVPVRSTERFFKVQALSCAWMAVSRWRIAVRLLGGGVGGIRILMIPYCAVHTLPPYRTVPYSERRVVLNFVQPLPGLNKGEPNRNRAILCQWSTAWFSLASS